MTAEICFKCLHWTEMGNSESKLHSLSTLPDSQKCIHGQLEIKIANRLLPSLGYCRPDNACINTWVQELMTILSTLDSLTEAVYVFDEGEEGQPAYEFRREFDLLFVSVVDSKISEGRGDPGFQSISCLWLDFAARARKCLTDLRTEIEREAGDVGEAWWLVNARTEI